MGKNKLLWIWCCPAVAVLCILGLLPLQGLSTSQIICASIPLYTAIDILVLVVCFSTLQKIEMLASWKFAVYLAVITAGSLYVNFLLVPVESKSILLFLLIAFILLALLNFVFLKITFVVSARKAALIGIIMGLIGSLLGILTNSVPN